MRTLLLSVFTVVLFGKAVAQKNDLPIKEWNANTSNPLLFYISGDGGFNNFSTGLCTELNKAGYAVAALNSRSYFWSKKTSQQTSGDISAYLEKALARRKNQQIVLIGYSFGADALPFIINRLSASLKNKLIAAILMAPSASADFEIHISDMLGAGRKGSMNVVAEINKLGLTKTVIIPDEEDKSFSAKSIVLKNLFIENLAGGHHFDGETKMIAQKILKYCK